MSSLDLPEIRARLNNAGRGPSRTPRRGPFGALKSLLSPPQTRPLLGPPEEPPPGPPPRSRSPELELLHADAQPSIALEPRRSTFGRRSDPSGDDEAEPLLLTPVHSVASPRQSAWTTEAVEAAPAASCEVPFLPDDLADEASGAPEPGPEPEPPLEAASFPSWSPTPEQAVLERLEQRLLEEHMNLIRKLAGR